MMHKNRNTSRSLIFTSHVSRFPLHVSNPNKSFKAFTLIELLIVIAILAVVTSVIAACFAGGIRVWEKARDLNKIESEALMGMEIMQRDFVNAFRFYGIEFNGETAKMSFPGLVEEPVADASSGAALARIGTIKYFFDADQKALLKKQWIYPAGEPVMGKTDEIISNLESLELNYSDSTTGEDQNSWNSRTNFPGKVRIRLSFKDNNERVMIERTVLLPVKDIQSTAGK